MNKHFAKWAAAALAFVLLFSANLSAHAAEPEAEQPTQQQLAQMLYELQLFRGTDQGFELDRPMSRGEAAVMVTRFFGGEQQALEQNQPAPFEDVSDWAAPYVGWLYRNGLTQGISPTQYGAKQQITLVQFAVMLNRRLEPEKSYQQCAEYGCQIASQHTMAQGNRPILRGEAVQLAADGLSCIAADWDSNLAGQLLNQGAFTLEAWEKAAAPVWGTTILDRRTGQEDQYQLEKQVNGITLAQSQPISGRPVQLCSLDQGKMLYTVSQNEQISLYILEESTMELQQVGQPIEGRYAWNWDKQGQFCYFAVETSGGDLSFYRADSQSCQLIQDKGLVFTLSKDAKYNGTYCLRSLDQGLFLCCLEGLYKVSQAGDALRQVVGGAAVRDVISQGDQLYYTTFKGEVAFEYCWDGQRVSVSQAWAQGTVAAGLTGQQWAQKEQQRLDSLYAGQ